MAGQATSGDEAVVARLSSDDARKFVMEASNVGLWRLAVALGSEGPPLPGDVPVRLVASMLEVGEPETWERSTRATVHSKEPFVPYCEMPKDEGRVYRSWLPTDLGADDEGRIRILAHLRVRRAPVLRDRVRERCRM